MGWYTIHSYFCLYYLTWSCWIYSWLSSGIGQIYFRSITTLCNITSYFVLESCQRDFFCFPGRFFLLPTPLYCIGYYLMFCTSIGASTSGRKILPKVPESANDGSCSTDNIFNVTTFVLKLLPSKDGAVLRRLLMTAVSYYTLDCIQFYRFTSRCYTIAVRKSLWT